MLSGNCSNATKQRRKAARLDKDARIAIIGSGLGGLSAAISLEQAGFTNVVVYERHVSPSSRREGYGLTLTYNPKGPLAQMGLLDQVAQQDCPSRSHYIFSVGQRVGLCCFRQCRHFCSGGERFLPYTCRSPLSLYSQMDRYWDTMEMNLYQTVARDREAICVFLDKYCDN
jgi:NAD(P)-binding Rossmann-like domain